jgi:hypothetical protein
LNSEMIRKIWNISVWVIITPKETPCSSLPPPPPQESMILQKKKKILILLW